MCKFWKKPRSPFESSAKVVDGHLILSLPDALNPVVWRMELGSVKSSAVEVRANDNRFLLTLKTPKGDIHDIAPYDSRDKAVTALLKVSEALEGAEGKIANKSESLALPSEKIMVKEVSSSQSGYKWLIALAVVIGLIFLFSYLSSLTPGTVSLDSPQSTPNAPAEPESGVPQSADDYLRGF
jgi:hypothetical protein